MRAARGEASRYDVPIRAAHNQVIIVDFSIQPLRDGNGEIVFLVPSAIVITERKRAEEALREREEILRLFVEHSPAAIGMLDHEMRYIAVSRRWLTDYGLDQQNVIGRSHYEIFPEVPQRWKEIHRRCLAGATERNDEDSFVRTDGRIEWLRWEICPWRKANDNIGGIIIFSELITEHKQAEAALRVSEERMRLAVTGAGLGTWHWDIASGELLWSVQCLAIFGLAADTAMSYDKFLGALHSADREFVDNAVRRALDTHSEYKIECRAVWPDGSEHWIASSGRGYYDAAGRPLRMEGVSWDITPRMHAQLSLREANESLEQKVAERTAQLQATQMELRAKNQELQDQYRRVQAADRLKSEFLANMSHELRTPLNAIIGFSELMHDGKVGAVALQHKEYLGDILTSAKHLLQLINDVLDLAKIEAGKLEFRPEPVDLFKTFSEVRDVVRALMLRKRVRVNIEVDPMLTGIVADAAKLKQILYNYLSNALKFSPDASEIALRARVEDAQYFRIEVEDRGIGIDAADIGRLFGEFEQLDAGAAKKHGGTGLGLALTKRIVETQGGCVGVHSIVGQGSTFYAVLPRVLVHAEAANLTADATTDGQAARRSGR